MTNKTVYPVSEKFAKQAWVNEQQYQTLYQYSIDDPEAFWAEHGKRLDWIKPYNKARQVSFSQDNVDIRWYESGVLNASYNCVDRHLATRADDVAIFWEADEPNAGRTLTYRDLYHQVCRCANALEALGLEKGDIVAIYMPMIPEAAIAMLACARIGAVHSVVFGGFSPEALAGRIEDSQAKVVITADQGIRAGRTVPLKDNVDQALAHTGTESVHSVLVVRHTHAHVPWQAQRDYDWHTLLSEQKDTSEPAPMNAEDPLFILYTSGSTGQPKGVLHTTGGYLVYASMTHQYIFDYHPGDVYWCCADVGWITGHTYMVYGPMANGATSVFFEGVPNYPTQDRLGAIIEKYRVNILYTAPTLIRSLMMQGDQAVAGHCIDSLKVLGSVGEPINPEAWHWYHQVIGQSCCPIMDTWWQTETGGILITPLPGATALKPGSATRPFFGINPAIVDSNGKILEGEAQGSLVLKDSWPGQSRTLYGDHDRFVQNYFSTFPGYYFSGDGARRDKDGYYWITGRVDDVINVSGHRMGTAEVESALATHPDVAEAAVVGVPHPVKGESIYAYVVINHQASPTDALEQALIQWVRKEIGAFAKPDTIHFAEGLPKTRSGKIMRRILRKLAVADYDNLGDISTLADPAIIDKLIASGKVPTTQ